MSIVPVLFTVSALLVLKVVVPVPVVLRNSPLLLNVPLLVNARIVPSPVAVSVPALLNVPPMSNVPDPLHTPAVLWLVKVRVWSCGAPLIDRPPPAATAVEPVPDCVPPLQVSPPSSTRVPLPPSVPLDIVSRFAKLSALALLKLAVPPCTLDVPVPAIP